MAYPTLVLALVHGIGPQPSDLHRKFMSDVWAETEACLRRNGHENLANTLANRLVAVRANWSTLYMTEQGDWLTHFSPRIKADSRRAIRAAVWAALWRLILYLVAGSIVYVATGKIVSHLPGVPWNRWVLSALAGLVVMLLEEWLWGAYRFPWGSLWMVGRGFEAFTLSDIILYGSPDPQRRIDDTVLRQIEDSLKGPTRPRAIGGDATRSSANRIPVLLAGHSQGSVIVYDLLKDAAQNLARAGTSAPERELERLTGEYNSAQATLATRQDPMLSQRVERLQATITYLQRRVNLIQRIYPIGMITFGSPVAVFLFRDPSVARRQDGWQTACPPDFSQTGEYQGLRWRWQNFWHASDFVAHRLEPFFNAGFPPPGPRSSKFVDDIKTRRPALHPVEAHSSYWSDHQVVRTTGFHVAECVIALDAWTGVP